MNQTRDMLFALARQRFTSPFQERVTALSCDGDVDWELVAAIAAGEGVAPIVGVNLAACKAVTPQIPTSVAQRFQNALFENVALKAARRRQLVDGVAHFDLRGYDVLLLKSAALEASGVYHHPWVTAARDVDLVLRRRNATSASVDEWAVRAVSRDSGIECEVNGHHDLSVYGLVNVSFEKIWQSAHQVPFGEPTNSVYVMCPEDLLFTLCLNTCRQRYFRLKALFDIAEAIAHHADLDWQSLVARARTSDSEGIVFTALCAADETLGLPAVAREHYTQLVSRGYARLLRALIKTSRRSPASPPRLRALLLRYASFNNAQRLRAARRTLQQWPSRVLTSTELADGALPGQ